MQISPLSDKKQVEPFSLIYSKKTETSDSFSPNTNDNIPSTRDINAVKRIAETRAQTPGPTVTLQLHTNGVYSEFDDKKIRENFFSHYRAILDVFDEFPFVKISWDFEASETLFLFKDYAPDIIERIKKGIKEERFEVQNVVAPFSLGPTLEKEDFIFQLKTAQKQLENTFGKVASGYFAQESAYTPELIDELAGYVDYILVKKDQTKINSKTNYTTIKGNQTEIPCFLFEGIDKETVDITKKLKQLVKSKDEQIIILESDTEFFDPIRLRKLFKQWENIPNVKFNLPSGYAKANKPDGDTKLNGTSWIGNFFPEHFRNNYAVWMWDDKGRQHLSHLEEARKNFREAEFLNNNFQLFKQDELTTSYDLFTLGTNSDNLGWNPCEWKRKKGYKDLDMSIQNSQAVKKALYEKDILKPNEILLFNPEKTKTTLPGRIKLEFERGECFDINLECIKYDYFAERYHDGSIRKAELYILEELLPQETKKVKISTSKNSESYQFVAPKYKFEGFEELSAKFTDEGLEIKGKDKTKTITTSLNGLKGEKLSNEPSINVGEKGLLKKMVEGRYFKLLPWDKIYQETKCLVFPETSLVEIDKNLYFNKEKNITIEPFQIEFNENKITRENLTNKTTIDVPKLPQGIEEPTANSFADSEVYYTTRNKFDDIYIKDNKINVYHTEPDITAGFTWKYMKNFFHLLVTDPMYLIRLAKKTIPMQYSRLKSIDNTMTGTRHYNMCINFNRIESDNPTRIIFPFDSFKYKFESF